MTLCYFISEDVIKPTNTAKSTTAEYSSGDISITNDISTNRTFTTELG